MRTDKERLCFVRKVDDVGRITLPIQLREMCNIDSGDRIEMTCNDNGQVIIKKHRALDYALASSKKILDGFYNTTKIPVVLCNRNEIISVKGLEKINCFDLSDDFFAQIRRKDKTVYPDIYLNRDRTIGVQDFRFIIHDGVYIGAVVITNRTENLTEADKQAFEVCIAAINAYMC